MQTDIKPINYLYITANNQIMGRYDDTTYTKENQGQVLSIPLGTLANAKSRAMDLAFEKNLESTDIVISLNNKELIS